MEIKTSRDIESNIEGSVEFKTTSNTAKLFSMLSSFLYSNKHLAVLHELSSNAMDAHKLVGKYDTPIKVVLPTSLSQNLTIRDYGPGLSHDNVVRFLTTYGESDKQHSNEMIGGYGIGSKSPAAVTDMWNVVSHHEGVMNHYIVTISKSGVPSLTKIRTAPTEETGLEVTIPVDKNDVNVWYSAVSSAYTYYDVYPDIHNYQGNPLTRCDYSGWLITSDEFALQSTKVYGGNSHIVVVNGVRGYTLNYNKLQGFLPDDAFAFFSKYKFRIDLKFKLNDVEVDLSRENLSYTDFTCRVISARLLTLFEEIKKVITTSIDSSSLLKFYISVSNAYIVYGTCIFDIIYPNKYNVRRMADVTDIETEFFNINDYKILHVGDSGKIKTVKTSTKYHATIRCVNDGTKYHLRIRLNQLHNVVFVLHDAKDAFNRVRQESNINKEKKYLIVDAESIKLLPDELKEMTISSSSLPPVTSRSVVTTPKKSITTNFYRREYGRFLKVDAASVEKWKADKATIIWFNIKSGLPLNCQNQTLINQIKLFDCSHYLKDLKNNYVLLGIKGETKPDFGIHINEYLKEAYAEYLNFYRETWGAEIYLARVTNENIIRIFNNSQIKNKLPNNVIEFMNEFNDIKKSADRFSTEKKYLKEVQPLIDEYFDLKDLKVSDKIKKNDLKTQVYIKKFSMIKYIGLYYSFDKDDLTNVLDYVNMVCSINKEKCDE